METETRTRVATGDVYEAGWLLAGGAALSDVAPDRSGPETKVVFTFQGGHELEELQNSYFSGTAVVNLAEYRKGLERAKDMMFRLLRATNPRGKSRKGAAR
jgi:hypothetical protein